LQPTLQQERPKELLDELISSSPAAEKCRNSFRLILLSGVASTRSPNVLGFLGFGRVADRSACEIASQAHLHHAYWDPIHKGLLKSAGGAFHPHQQVLCEAVAQLILLHRTRNKIDHFILTTL